MINFTHNQFILFAATDQPLDSMSMRDQNMNVLSTNALSTSAPSTSVLNMNVPSMKTAMHLLDDDKHIPEAIELTTKLLDVLMCQLLDHDPEMENGNLVCIEHTLLISLKKY